MFDAAKIQRDLETLALTLDIDRNQLAEFSMSAEQRKEMQHHIAHCLHSLRELEFALEGLKPVTDDDADFLV